jgi:hypothetical protein
MLLWKSRTVNDCNKGENSMGLDMYLEKCDRRAWGFRNVDISDAKENNPKLYEEIKPYIHQRGKYPFWESLFEEVGYWRKANAIHKWFVDNVQDGDDDCGYYEVTKEQLEELLNICNTIKDKTQIESGWVKNGERFENGMWCPIYEEGEVMVNPEIAEDLLPTQEGFFFGGTDYDQYYMDDIESTIDILTKVHETTDFDMEMIVYTSSW